MTVRRLTPLVCAAALLCAAPASAQITLSQSTIGVTPAPATGGSLSLRAWLGEPVVGVVTGGTVELCQGVGCALGGGVLATDLAVTAWLQGAYSSGAMRTDLRDGGLIPLAQPYGAAPLSYPGTEATTPAVLAAHAVVDWVLVELRATADGAAVERHAALLLADGSILAADGAGAPAVTATGDHYVVVWHRNHLAAMTPTAVSLGAADLTAGLYGSGGVEVEAGVWALVAGDADGNGSVLANDRQSVWLPAVGAAGYEAADLDLDGSVLAGDRQVSLDPNVGRASQVPGAASLTGGETESVRAAEPAARRPAARPSRGSRE